MKKTVIVLSLLAALTGAAEPFRPAERWRGFNLLEMFVWWPKIEKPAYRESDFKFLKENGFNFVRLPIDYRFWTHGGDWTKIDPDWVKPVDDAIAWGEKYGIHVQINLHRGPGYCVNRGESEPKKLFGPLDSDREDVDYEDWNGHKLDRKMLELLKRY